MFYIVVGASLALSYGTRNALIGMLLSVFCYGLVNSVLSRFASRAAAGRWRCFRGCCSAAAAPAWRR